MPKPKHIEPKPTSYRGQLFRSKLEARWAVFLDYHFIIDSWQYEPHTFALPQKGWTYTPDFLFRAGPFVGYIEVKPKAISEQQEYVYTQMLQQLGGVPLYLGIGTFYKRKVPTLQVLGETQKLKLYEIPWLPSSNDAIQMARNFRFDLVHAAPPIRSGSASNVHGHILEWAEQQRKGVKKKKSQRRKKK